MRAVQVVWYRLSYDSLSKRIQVSLNGTWGLLSLAGAEGISISINRIRKTLESDLQGAGWGVVKLSSHLLGNLLGG